MGYGEVPQCRPFDLKQLVKRIDDIRRVHPRPRQEMKPPLFCDQIVPLGDQANTHVDVFEAQGGLSDFLHEEVKHVVVEGEGEVVPLEAITMMVTMMKMML